VQGRKENGGRKGNAGGEKTWGGEKEGRGREGINLPHGRLKTLAALLLPETTNSILRIREGSSVLRIRVGVPHFTKFDAGRFDVGGVRLHYSIRFEMKKKHCSHSTVSSLVVFQLPLFAA